MVNINASRFATIRGQKKGADRDGSLVLSVRWFHWFNQTKKPPSQKAALPVLGREAPGRLSFYLCGVTWQPPASPLPACT
jgi:hypothetical protein